MTETSPNGLQRGYERLLRWYPPSHRERHADEMIGVLMAAARPGQRRPGRAESVNLIAGALRIRLRAALDGPPGQPHDTLALATLILPLVLWGGALAQFTLTELDRSLAHAEAAPPRLVSLLPALLLAIPAVLGSRRGTAIMTAVLASAQIALLTGLHYGVITFGLGVLFTVSILTVEGAALAASAGPGRGRAQLTRLNYLLVTGAALAAGAIVVLGFWLSSPLPLSHLSHLLVLTALVALVAAPLLRRTAMRRRLLLVLTLPAYYLAVAIAAPELTDLDSVLALLPLVVVPVAIASLALRRRHVRRLAAGPDGAR
jgi:hypothetical protein